MTDKKNAPTLPGESAAPTAEHSATTLTTATERDFLSGALKNMSEVAHHLRSKVTPNMFSTPARQAIWEAMTLIAADNVARGEGKSDIATGLLSGHTALYGVRGCPEELALLIERSIDRVSCEMLADTIVANHCRRIIEGCAHGLLANVWGGSPAVVGDLLGRLGAMYGRWAACQARTVGR